MISQVNQPRGFVEEFATVDLLMRSSTRTGRTDAFVIAWIKKEKQVRRIFNHLLYQYAAFSKSDVQGIIDRIALNRKLEFESFIRGFDSLYPITFKQIVGSRFSSFQSDWVRMKEFRNKIFHGQQTGQGIGKQQLIKEIDIIRDWCLLVAQQMDLEIGYDGLVRNAFRKSSKDLAHEYRRNITNMAELEIFVKNLR
jgi:hypothetical protein